MQKLVTIVGAVLLLAGVGAAGTFASLGSGSEDNPTIATEPLRAATTARHADVRPWAWWQLELRPRRRWRR
jgi:hypothetical protein